MKRARFTGYNPMKKARVSRYNSMKKARHRILQHCMAKGFSWLT
jgi:hypothetical protein